LRLVVIAVLSVWAAQVASSAELHGLATAAESILGADQGVYVETADGTVLLAQAASKPVHPASVSKVPTTLALLRKLGPEHRFVTTFTAKGRVVDGTLYGDLIVASDGDPSLVDEDALLVAERLRQSGISKVAGTLELKGPLTFDWKTDSDGASLRRALSGVTSPAALAAVRALLVLDATSTTAVASNTGATGAVATANVRAAGNVLASAGGASLAPLGIHFVAPMTVAPATAVGSTTTTLPVAASNTSLGSSAASGGAQRVVQFNGEHPLIVHRSQQLLPLAKSLNDYSNNIFAPFAEAAGGAAAVETLARSVVPEEMKSEITLGDGAGENPTNRLSPRAAVKLLRVLEQELAKSDHALYDILPVAGVDDGTLHDRINGPGEAGHVLGKTGTYGDYGASALIGAIRTTDLGTVYFAILNHNVPVPQARHRQDRFVRFLLSQLHTIPWAYQRDPRPAITRAEVAIMLP
jgi:D-alanyl-D-alanine carboxypeptidase/D-alanyl-D-alanine-endopeptidase (penicillin-binding protein 4)